MRDPSLHIKKSDLKALLKEYGVRDFAKLTTFLLTEGRTKKPYNRTVFLKSNTQQRKKVTKLAQTGTTDADLFNRILEQQRIKAQHRFIKTVRKNSRDYQMLRDVSDLATEFCDVFGFENTDQGFAIYCEIGLRIMGKKYGLNKFKYHNTRIFEMYEGYFVVKEDPYPERTKEMYEQWEALMDAYAGTVPKFDDYTKMRHLVYARQEADEVGADYYEWLDATFLKLSFLEAVPELNQFYGENAKERYLSYRIQKNKPDTVDKSRIKDVNPANRDYFAKLDKLKSRQ